MGINITTYTMNNSQFENRESLKNTAKYILNKQGAGQEKSQQIIEKTLFPENNYARNSQLLILNSSAQITLNNSLKETLKYLQTHAQTKKSKPPILGEIWNGFKQDDTAKEYSGELIDFEIDNSFKNIFEAA